MRKLIAGCVGVVSMASLSFGQIEVGASLGYGFAAGKELIDANTEENASGDYTEYKEVYASGGGGLKIDIDGVYFLNENIGVMAAIGFSFLGGAKVTQKDPTGTDEFKLTYSYLPINIGMKLKAELGSVTPYAYVAPGLYIVFGSGEINPATGSTAKISEKFAPGFGFSSGIGATMGLSDKIGIKAEIAPTYAFANLKEETYEVGGVKQTIVYQNNEKTLSTDTPTKSYEHGQPRQSFSSVAIKVGVTFGL